MSNQQQGGNLEGGRLLQEVMLQDPRLGQLFQNVIDGVNRLGVNAGASPVGDIQAPKPPDAVSVKVSGELMHISISHSGPLQRGIRYFSEISTTPAFGQPIVVDHGTSRTSHPVPLPTKDDTGAAVTYYVRSYAQHPGGPPSEPTVAGGIGSPTGFTMGGTTHLTLLPSTGSGTGPNTGQSAGQGLGKFQRRNS